MYVPIVVYHAYIIKIDIFLHIVLRNTIYKSSYIYYNNTVYQYIVYLYVGMCIVFIAFETELYVT